MRKKVVLNYYYIEICTNSQWSVEYLLNAGHHILHT